MRVAIYGGTFDPVHNAHLTVAEAARRTCSLDEVLFVPASRPPHKRAGTSAGYEDRYRMVELACAGHPGFAVSRVEAPAGAEGTAPQCPGEHVTVPARASSYSIYTIETLRARRPEDEWFFLIGADAFAEIRTWRRWEDVVRLVEFIVVSRPGHAYDTPAGARVHRLESLQMTVSSSEIRRKLRAGESTPELPPAVAAYIRDCGLYREGEVDGGSLRCTR